MLAEIRAALKRLPWAREEGRSGYLAYLVWVEAVRGFRQFAQVRAGEGQALLDLRLLEQVHPGYASPQALAEHRRRMARLLMEPGLLPHPVAIALHGPSRSAGWVRVAVSGPHDLAPAVGWAHRAHHFVQNEANWAEPAQRTAYGPLSAVTGSARAAQRLMRAGFLTPQAIAAADAQDVAQRAVLSVRWAERIVARARRLMKGGKGT